MIPEETALIILCALCPNHLRIEKKNIILLSNLTQKVDVANKTPISISVINMKGGVGKTTIAALLGRYASIELELKVLMIDLDPQANLSQAFMKHQEYRQFLANKSPSIVEVFKKYQPPTPGTPSPSPLKVSEMMIGNTDLGGRNLQLIPSRFDFSDNLVNSIKPDPKVLAQLIANNFQEKDLIIIDCAPTESIFTQAAYHASRYILVPVKPEYFATIGFPLLNDSLNSFRNENKGQDIDVIGTVINNSTYHYSGNWGGPERETAMEEIRQEARKSGWKVFKNDIPLSRGFPKMMRGVFTHLGDAPLFDNFASELFKKLKLE